MATNILHPKATAGMTDRQILNECRPKPLYYTNTYGKRTARPCLLCGETVPGTFEDLENHAERIDIPKYGGG